VAVLLVFAVGAIVGFVEAMAPTVVPAIEGMFGWFGRRGGGRDRDGRIAGLRRGGGSKPFFIGLVEVGLQGGERHLVESFLAPFT
jgi:hypothetical protein